MVNLQKQQYN